MVGFKEKETKIIRFYEKEIKIINFINKGTKLEDESCSSIFWR
jgi:hypothetical protein